MLEGAPEWLTSWWAFGLALFGFWWWFLANRGDRRRIAGWLATESREARYRRLLRRVLDGLDARLSREEAQSQSIISDDG